MATDYWLEPKYFTDYWLEQINWLLIRDYIIVFFFQILSHTASIWSISGYW